MEIYKKLLKVKKEIGAISKESTNPFFKSKYFDINTLIKHVEPILNTHGLVLLQPIEDGVVKSLIINAETGDKIESGIQIPQLDDPQKIGSCITYYRRYSLQSLLGLEAEDDDANRASGNNSKTNGSPKNDDNKAWLNEGDKAWNKALEKGLSVKELRAYYKISKANAAEYEKQLNAKVLP